MSLSSCELRFSYLNLFKDVTVGISVVEVTAILYENISTKLNKRKPYQCAFMVLLLPVCYQGIITVEEV